MSETLLGSGKGRIRYLASSLESVAGAYWFC